nr:hypothetical protein CFP56_34901 [Quercus suber]
MSALVHKWTVYCSDGTTEAWMAIPGRGIADDRERGRSDRGRGRDHVVWPGRSSSRMADRVPWGKRVVADGRCWAMAARCDSDWVMSEVRHCMSSIDFAPAAAAAAADDDDVGRRAKRYVDGRRRASGADCSAPLPCRRECVL